MSFWHIFEKKEEDNNDEETVEQQPQNQELNDEDENQSSNSTDDSTKANSTVTAQHNPSPDTATKEVDNSATQITRKNAHMPSRVERNHDLNTTRSSKKTRVSNPDTHPIVSKETSKNERVNISRKAEIKPPVKNKIDLKANLGRQPSRNSNSEDKQPHTLPNKNVPVSQPIIVTRVSNNKKIANDFRFTGPVGKQLHKEDVPEVQGYKLVSTNFNYRVSTQEQKVVFRYVPTIVNYRLVPVNEAGKEIDDSAIKIAHGKPGDPIIAFPNIKGYRVFKARKYQVPETDSDVKVVYGATTQNLHVVYTTVSGDNLLEETLHGKTGEPYLLEPQKHHFEGYELVKTPNNLSGKYANEDKTITITYQPVTTKLTVLFLDHSGNAIHKPAVLQGKYKTAYSIPVPKIEGYEMDSDPSLLTGNYDREDKQVALRFRKATVKFKINYWFDSAKTQRADKPKIVTGTVDDKFHLIIPHLEGYTSSKDAIEGTFKSSGNDDVDVFYTKIRSTLKIYLDDEAGRPLPNVKPLLTSGNWGEKYSVELPEVNGFDRPEKVYTGTFDRAEEVKHINYSANQVTLMVSYIDSKTQKEIADYPAQPISGQVGTSYSVQPRMIDGYRVKKMPKNSSGVFTAEPKDVVFEYEPNYSEIVIHSYDNALNPLGKAQILKGFYNAPYNIQKIKRPGYEFEKASAELRGTFPATRKDISVYYKAKNISFVLVPVAENNKKPIDDRYNLSVEGLVNENWSRQLPEIPGYEKPIAQGRDVNRVGSKITPDLNGKQVPLFYRPKQEEATIHFVYEGGSQDGVMAYKDFIATGLMGERYHKICPEIKGYTAQPKAVDFTFDAEPKSILVKYIVNREDYQITFVDPNGNVVGQLPKANGYYHETIDITQNHAIPNGYHLPTGADSQISLDGSKIYKVSVLPDDVMINLTCETEDGISLGSSRQIPGKFHESRTINVPVVPGYNPVKGKKITLNFDLNETTIPIIYKAKTSKIVVRFYTISGQQIHEPMVYSGQYQDSYEIKAPNIDGYMVVDNGIRQGTYGLDDSETVFSYRAGSDEASKAITPLSDLTHQTAEMKHPIQSSSNNEISSEPTNHSNHNKPPKSLNDLFDDDPNSIVQPKD